MNTFKVICKGERKNWKPDPLPNKIVTSSLLFGLIKKTRLEVDDSTVNGPEKNEVCIVNEVSHEKGNCLYKLSGYGDNRYVSKYFIRLDEITETQKEIAEKAIPVLN